jgi:hypothetical protein
VLERYTRIVDRAVTNMIDDLAALARRARPDAGPKQDSPFTARIVMFKSI